MRESSVAMLADVYFPVWGLSFDIYSMILVFANIHKLESLTSVWFKNNVADIYLSVI